MQAEATILKLKAEVCTDEEKKGTFPIIIMNQGMGPGCTARVSWDTFLAGMKDGTFPYANHGHIKEAVDETFSPPWGTETYRRDEHGMAAMWKTNYDTSG